MREILSAFCFAHLVQLVGELYIPSSIEHIDCIIGNANNLSSLEFVPLEE